MVIAEIRSMDLPLLVQSRNGVVCGFIRCSDPYFLAESPSEITIKEFHAAFTAHIMDEHPNIKVVLTNG